MCPEEQECLSACSNDGLYLHERVRGSLGSADGGGAVAVARAVAIAMERRLVAKG